MFARVLFGNSSGNHFGILFSCCFGCLGIYIYMCLKSVNPRKSHVTHVQTYLFPDWGTGGDIPSRSLTVRLCKIHLPNRKVVFQPPFFRGELLNFGGVVWGTGYLLKDGSLPSGKLTWQWNIPLCLKRKCIFKGSIFHCYVKLPECKSCL